MYADQHFLSIQLFAKLVSAMVSYCILGKEEIEEKTSTCHAYRDVNVEG